MKVAADTRTTDIDPILSKNGFGNFARFLFGISRLVVVLFMVILNHIKATKNPIEHLQPKITSFQPVRSDTCLLTECNVSSDSIGNNISLHTYHIVN